jgi:hypothetical protein
MVDRSGLARVRAVGALSGAATRRYLISIKIDGVLMAAHPRRPQLSVILEPKTREVLEREAVQERRPLSSMARKVLADWADQLAEQTGPRAA